MSTSTLWTLHSSAPRCSIPHSLAPARPIVLADHLRRHITCTDQRAPLSSPEFCQHQGNTALVPRQRQLLAAQGDGRHALTVQAFDERPEIPGQSEALTRGLPGSQQVLELPERPADVDYLSELIAVQQAGPREIGFFGTRNMGFLHQNLIEVLSYATVLTDNHVFTSGATGTNAAVIRGALRAEKPHLLTVVLPQSLSCQPSESQELLQQVQNIEEMPQNDYMSLLEASRICNRKIVTYVKQVICFAFHDSRLLLETCDEAKACRKMVTLFYLD